jgi:hypothetical protein
MMWSWGQNNSGELGLNDSKVRLYPHPILTLKKKKIKTFACGGAFAVCLGQDKQVATPSLVDRHAVLTASNRTQASRNGQQERFTYGQG